MTPFLICYYLQRGSTNSNLWKSKNKLLKLNEKISGLPKVIFLAVAEGKGEGAKTSALKVEAEDEAEGLVFCI